MAVMWAKANTMQCTCCVFCYSSIIAAASATAASAAASAAAASAATASAAAAANYVEGEWRNHCLVGIK